MNKKELRKYVRMQKQMFTHAQLSEWSQAVTRRLLSHPRVKSASTILMYYSLADEVDTHAAIEELLRQGKTVLLPAVVSDTAMEVRHYRGPQDLAGGFFDIMEPVGQPFADLSLIDVVIVPGMGFDRQGNRLGRGKGYYDRFLAQLPTTYKIGVCFDFQKLPGIPTEPTDIKVDEVI